MASRAAVVRCSEVARRRARRGRGPSEAQEEQEAVPIHLHLHLLIPCSAASSRPPCPSRGRRRRRCLGEGRAIEVREARRERHREWGLQAGVCPAPPRPCFQPPQPLSRSCPTPGSPPPVGVCAGEWGGRGTSRNFAWGSVGPQDQVRPTPELLEPCWVEGGVGLQPSAPSAYKPYSTVMSRRVV